MTTSTIVAGFQISVTKTAIKEDIAGVGCGYLFIEYFFEDLSKKTKYMTTAIYNEIKKQPAFKTVMMNEIDAFLTENKSTIKDISSRLDPSNRMFGVYYPDRMSVHYHGKKLGIRAKIMTDLPQLRKDLEKMIDGFIASKKTNVRWKDLT